MSDTETELEAEAPLDNESEQTVLSHYGLR